MPLIDWDTLPKSTGMSRGFDRSVVSGEKMSAIKMTVDVDADFGDPLHWHDNEQLMVVVGGSATVQINDDRFDVTVGDTVFYPSGSRHGLLAVGAGGCTFFEVFAPARLDQLPGWMGRSALHVD